MRKITLRMVFIFFCGAATAPSWAETEDVNGIVWTYSVVDDCAVIGREGCAAISETTAGDLVIPDRLGGHPVTGIGDWSFILCAYLTSIKVPETVTSIGARAFRACTALTSVNIPEGVTNIGFNAFKGCSALTTLLLPSSLVTIGDNAFADCPAVVSTNQMFLTDGGTVVSWFDRVQSDGNVVIPEGVTTIGDRVFSGYKTLSSVALPSSLINIGAYSFANCYNLTSLEIPTGVVSIGNGAFAGCSNLVYIAIPPSVKGFGVNVFQGCKGLAQDGLIVFNGLLLYGGTYCGSLDIPEAVTGVCGCAFTDNSSLTSVTIHANVKHIGSEAFSGCSSLSKVVFLSSPPDGVVSSGLLTLPGCAVYYTAEQTSLWSNLMRGNMSGSNRTTVEIISSKMRTTDPTIMDVTYKAFRRFNVLDADPDVAVRALAFQDGERSFWKVVRATEFVNDLDGNPTTQNIGDAIEPNIEHKLAWKVSKDWKTDLAKVKFEVLCSDQAQLPLKLNHIKAVGKYPALTIGVGTQTDADIFNALLWWYACGDEHLVNVDGYVDCTNVTCVGGTRWVNRTSIAGERMDIEKWLYAKMGYEPLIGGNLMSYVRTATRKELWWNTGTRNCVIKADTKPAQLYVGEKAYCVIDVSGGPDAEKYPVTYLDYEPTAGWSDEYKTTKILLRRCEAGQYMMQNTKQVTLTKPFYMGVFTVTQKQYMQVMGTNPTQSDHQGDLRPVEISWNAIRGDSATYNWPTVTTVDPSMFIGKIQSKTGLNFDLPTEAQWEYACRAGTSSNYGNGGGGDNDLRLMGHSWSDNAVNVGLYQPNFWGFYDMHGNVGQWCLDYSDGYNSDPAIDYVGAESGSARAIRGGIGGYYSYYYGFGNSFSRYGGTPSSGCYKYISYNTNLGFRFSLTLND